MPASASASISARSSLPAALTPGARAASGGGTEGIYGSPEVIGLRDVLGADSHPAAAASSEKSGYESRARMLCFLAPCVSGHVSGRQPACLVTHTDPEAFEPAQR